MELAAPKRPWWKMGERITHEHFFVMLVLALALHLSGLIWWYRWFNVEPIEIPVRVINLRLGSGGEIFARGGGAADGEAEAQQESAAPAATVQDIPQPARPVVSADSLPASLRQAAAPAAEDAAKAPDKLENTPAAPTVTAAEQVTPVVPEARAPRSEDELPLAASETAEGQEVSAEQLQSVVAQPPSAAEMQATGMDYAMDDVHYTRAAGSRAGEEERIRAQIMARYEQQLSAWIQKYKRYPQYAQKRGITGRGIVRIRINRKGQVLFSKLEMTTGSKLLDQAAMDMIRRADPMPPVPNAYGSGEQFEFQIPVIFK